MRKGRRTIIRKASEIAIRPAAIFLAAVVLTACSPSGDSEVGRNPEVQRILDAIREADTRIETIDITGWRNVKGAKIWQVYRRSSQNEYFRNQRASGRGSEWAIVDGYITEIQLDPYNANPEPFHAVINPSIIGLLGRPALPTRVPVGGTNLLDALERDAFEIQSESETLDGHDVVLMEGRNQNEHYSKRYLLYLDPSIGYLPRRVDFRTEGEYPDTHWELRDYQEVKEGIWIPHSVETYSHHPVTHVASRFSTFTIETVTVNKPIASEKFEVPSTHPEFAKP